MYDLAITLYINGKYTAKIKVKNLTKQEFVFLEKRCSISSDNDFLLIVRLI